MNELGVSQRGDGVDVAVFSAHATAIEFCVFDGARETRHRLRQRSGDIFHGHIKGITAGARYGLRAHGPYLPREGHRFNANKLLIDPYATALDAPLALHRSMLGYRDNDDLSFDDTDSAPHVPKAIVLDPIGRVSRALTPWDQTSLYELQVRGFTMRNEAIPLPLRGRFAGLAHPAAIGHLVDLGITAVEIMPAAAWIEERHLAAMGRTNYWGYNPIALMAPDPRLAPDGWDEIRATVAALEAAGIETILDVVLNHTGEADELGPTLSFRGLDNASYYRLLPDNSARYIDDTGCGNTIAFDRPAPLRLAMDTLRAWASRTGLHGVRFDLAATMGRRAAGFEADAPLLQAIVQDPQLRALKLIAEPWDPGPGGHRTGAFPHAWGEWNDRFRDDARRFWRGDPGMLGALATRLAGSADIFAAKRHPSRSINFITAHDGFTLADLTAYTHKRNHANGENNRDGTDANHAWNNGTEGPSDDPAVTEARRRDQRALLATLMLARGTPMLAMGSELGHSQHGNNNAYAADDGTAWLDWSAADPVLRTWTQALLRLRRDHPALRADAFLTGTGTPADVSWHNAHAGPPEWHDPAATTLVMILDHAVCLIHHRGTAETPIHLPPPQPGHTWRLLADSATGDTTPRTAASLSAPPRSVLLLAQHRTRLTGPDPVLIARLAQAAGIATDWWSVDGTRTAVSEDTNRALLAAMRLPATTSGEARDSLRALTAPRPLPPVIVARTDASVEIPMPLEPGLTRRAVWLSVTTEDGEKSHHRIGAEEPPRLPPLPPGRHTLRLGEAACPLIVAPPRCHLPDAFARGERRFGIAAQLYALRHDGDQGIGDFTTLARLSQAATRAGAATIGLNPLHMLFPDQRERASPYQPSDRRFLDPILIDLPEAGPGRADSVAYSEVWARKRAALEQRFAAASHDPALQHFIDQGGEALHRFATFQAIAEAHPGQPWQSWPTGLRTPDSADTAAFAAAHPRQLRFHQFQQYLAETQLAAAATGLEIGLFRDLAVGAAPDGAESWANAGLLAQGAWVGAPPDPFSADGQNWHLPPPLPHAMAADGYAAFSDLLRANTRHAGALRIDHIMGLARLFWIPDGGSGADGAYVSYPLADLIGILALESHRAGCMVVGEDLGTVPDGLRPALTAADILLYRVLLLERQGLGFTPAAAYPARAVASVSTHDLPPLQGWLDGADIAERASLGHLDAGLALATRAAEIAALADAAGPDPMHAAHAFIASTPCDLMLVQADDLAGLSSSVNLPGTDTERPNWRRRIPTPVETLLETDTARDILASVTSSSQRTG